MPAYEAVQRERRVASIVLAVFAVFLGLPLLIAPFVVRTYRIPTGSMFPAIHVGDHVVVYRLAYRSDSPHRGDVIAYREGKTTFMHRVIGRPGETLRIEDKRVFVNGALLEEPYVVHADETVFRWQPSAPEPYRSRDQLRDLKLGAEQYFVLGDNRDRSFDSRFRGPVHRSQIIGRTVYALHFGHEQRERGEGVD